MKKLLCLSVCFSACLFSFSAPAAEYYTFDSEGRAILGSTQTLEVRPLNLVTTNEGLHIVEIPDPELIQEHIRDGKLYLTFRDYRTYWRKVYSASNSIIQLEEVEVGKFTPAKTVHFPEQVEWPKTNSAEVRNTTNHYPFRLREFSNDHPSFRAR